MEPKIRVRFIDSAATSTVQYRRGEEYDLPERFARQMVAAKAAEPVDTEPGALPPPPVQRTVPVDDLGEVRGGRRSRKAGA